MKLFFKLGKTTDLNCLLTNSLNLHMLLKSMGRQQWQTRLFSIGSDDFEKEMSFLKMMREVVWSMYNWFLILVDNYNRFRVVGISVRSRNKVTEIPMEDTFVTKTEDGTTNCIKLLTKEDFQTCFQQWQERWNKCLRKESTLKGTLDKLYLCVL